MIRPVYADQPASRDILYQAMVEYDYPYIDYHLEYMHTAIVFVCFSENEIAGYAWFFRLEEDVSIWSFHVLIKPEYRKKFFSRTFFQTLFGTAWSLGANQIMVEEGGPFDLFIRVGGTMCEDGAILSLPYDWRKSWQKSSKKHLRESVELSAWAEADLAQNQLHQLNQNYQLDSMQPLTMQQTQT